MIITKMIPIAKRRQTEERLDVKHREISIAKEYLQSNNINYEEYPELVRCRDCRGYNKEGVCLVHSTIGLHESYVLVKMRPNDFCNYGMRW